MVNVTNRAATVHPSLLCGTISIGLAGLLSWWIGRHRFAQLRTIAWYPALWIGIVGSGCIYTIRDLIIGRSLDETMGGDLGWLFSNTPLWAWLISIALFALAGMMLIKTWNHKPRPLGLTDPNKSFNALVNWFNDDREVVHPDDDLFDNLPVAHRIANRLMSDGKDAPTIALFGPRGSGKSTIRNFVDFELRYRRNGRVRVMMVPISMWQYSSSRAAVEGILGSLLGALNSHGPNLAAAGIPKEFVTAASGVGHWSGILSALVHDSEPRGVIEEVESLVQELGVRVVLWVEDLERYAWPGPREGDMHDVEIERIGPIRSLLYLLDRAKGISVVHSDTSLRNRFDTEKLARYREQVPKLDAEYVWTQFARLRREMRADLVRFGSEDPANPKDRKPFDMPEMYDILIPSNRSIRHGLLSLPESLSLLCQNPRKLKMVLRAIWERWIILRGEIDFDGLILGCALAECAPDVFEIINEHFDGFVNGLGPRVDISGIPHEANPAQKLYLEQLNKYEKLFGGKYKDAIKRCVDHLFPENDQGRTVYRERSESSNPQSLSFELCWTRFNAVATTEPLDQNIIRDIRAWQSNRSSVLVQRMLDGDPGGYVQRFGRLIEAQELIKLFKEVLSKLSVIPASEWVGERNHPECMPVFLRMLTSKPFRTDWFATDLRAIIEELVPSNLPLLHEVRYWFDPRPENRVSLIEYDTFTSIENNMYEKIEKHYSRSTPAELADALMDGSAYVIHWLYRLIGSDLRMPNDAADLHGWATLANLLVELAKVQPKIGIAQTIPFVTKINEIRLPPSIDQPADEPAEAIRRVDFDVESAKIFFKDLDALLIAYRDAPESITEELQARHGDEIRDRWLAARAYAQKGAPRAKSSEADEPESPPQND